MQQDYKPDSVPSIEIDGSYHLSARSTPPDNKAGRFAPLRTKAIGIYMILQPERRAANNVAIAAGGLLPHLLTITNKPRFTGSYFLPRSSTLTDTSYFKSSVPFAVRTFLLGISQSGRIPCCMLILNKPWLLHNHIL